MSQLVVERLVLLDVQAVPLVEQLLVADDAPFLHEVLVNLGRTLLVGWNLSHQTSHLAFGSDFVEYRAKALRVDSKLLVLLSLEEVLFELVEAVSVQSSDHAFWQNAGFDLLLELLANRWRPVLFILDVIFIAVRQLGALIDIVLLLPPDQIRLQLLLAANILHALVDVPLQLHVLALARTILLLNVHVQVLVQSHDLVDLRHLSLASPEL